ncbi:MAG: acyl-coenzyme A synthetase/AMP-fatty acid ligase, partial [halophilic archaeon J07HB67]
MSGDAVGADKIVHEPAESFAESTNVRQFMREYGIDDHEALIERTTTDLPGEPASGVEWFWDEIVDYLGIEFDEPYDRVRDDTDGPQFSEWYPGGRLNVTHNVVERHATGDSANQIACLWEGEPGDERKMTFRDLSNQTARVTNYL